MAEVSASAPVANKEYETIYVLRPDIDSDTASRVSNRASEVIAREAGTLVKVESWGRRKLAYPVRKFRRGIYLYLRYLGTGKVVAEFERNLRMQKDAVLKFQTIKLRDDVDVAQITVTPDDVKFSAVEPQTDEERDESRERLLGLIDFDHHGRDDRSRERIAADAAYASRADDDDDDEMGEDSHDDSREEN